MVDKRDRYFGRVLIVLTLYLMVSGVQILMKQRWPHTTGRVTQNSFVSHYAHSSNTRRLALRYEYVVDGRTYEGTDVWGGLLAGMSMDCWFGTWCPGSAWPQGMDLPVYYDPVDPASAVLSRGFAPAEVGVFVFVVAGSLVLMRRRRAG